MKRLALLTVLLVLALSPRAAADVAVDLSGHKAASGVTLEKQGTRLQVRWPMAEKEYGVLVLRLEPKQALIDELGIAPTGDGKATSLLRQVDPATFLTVGSRDLSKQGWDVFFDNPPRRPHESFRAVLDPKQVRVESAGRRSTVILDGLSAGPFRGDLRFTVYPHCRLVHVQAVLSTDKDACAILYDAGLVRAAPDWKSVAWLDTNDKLQRVPADGQKEAAPVAVRQRAIVAEGEHGSVAVLAPPHQYLYPLDFADNFKLAWHGRGFQKSTEWGFGVRQPPEGDGRYVPWINAPPKTQQYLGVFYLLHPGQAPDALAEVRRFTHDDRFKKLDGYRTFTSHYHVEHTLDFLKQQKAQNTGQVPAGLEEPPFVQTFKARGVDIVHLAEFHVRHTPEMIAQRLEHLKKMHDECRRLSGKDFLLLPGEEPNVHLGGHWISLFPRPVYWQLHPDKDMPFERKVEGLGSVYAVHNADDVLRLMEKEQGLMWTAHARTKASYGFPDKYRDTAFYKSDRFLGAAWKAMPADLSQPRLGRRVLDLCDDMNNWGPRKQVLGEVDVFQVKPEYELYGHMNINYLQLDALPRFEDDWQPVLDALRQGRFFVSTGEVLLPEFRVAGKASGQTVKRTGTAPLEITARLEWTFPPAFAEVIWGNGTGVQRQRIDLSGHEAFAGTTVRLPLELKGAKWVRLEAWDVAANGAFSQPVWLE